MREKCDAKALGYSGAIVAALGMLVLGVLANLGIYTGAARMMEQWHLFFSLSVVGIIAGMLEAAVISFVALYLLAWFYNKLS